MTTSRFRPYDKLAPPPRPFPPTGREPGQPEAPSCDDATVIDIALAHGASFCVRFGDILCQKDGGGPAAAVVVPAYAGGKVLAATIGRFPQLCPAFSLANDAPEAKGVRLPESRATPVVVFTRYTRRTGAAFITAHWAAIAQEVRACACPPAGADTEPPEPVGVLRVPAFGVQNGVSFYEAARYLLYGAVAFLQDPELRGTVHRVELVLGKGGERVFSHVRRLAERCGVPPERPCIVCATFPRNVVSEPCGHWAVCSSCLHLANVRGNNADRCLVCRQETESNRELLRADTDATAVWAPCGHAAAKEARGCTECGEERDADSWRVEPFFPGN